MKRLCALLLTLALLLSGCAGGTEPPEQPSETVPPTTQSVTRPQPESFGTYDPDHPVELLTGGAVKRYRLKSEDYYDLRVMGEGVVLFSGEEETTLTRLRRDADPVSVTLENCRILAGSPSVRVFDEGISYYDSNDHTLVTLDGDLRETTRVSLPTNMVCQPVLSQDRQWVYYYVSDSLRSLELRSGISRLLQESSYPVQEVSEIHFDGGMLVCRVTVGEEQKHLLISTETGKTLRTLSEAIELTTFGQRFFALWYEAEVWMLLFGTRGEKIHRLELAQEGNWYPQLEQEALVLTQTDETGSTMTRYTLSEGEQVSSVRLSGVGQPVGVDTETLTGLIWFLARDIPGQEQALYCWDPTLSLKEQTTQVQPYYTREEPDTQGLAECEQQAKALADRYGIRIRLWKDAVSVAPEGYTLVSEYQVPVYQRSLAALEEALEDFPREIYTRLGKKSENGKLTICLVAEVCGSNELGSQTQETGVHFWHNGSAYLTLVLNDRLRKDFCHELFHAIDSYVLTECKVYDFWESLNPDGFAYDYSYVTNEYRDPGTYLDPEDRCFIDRYSMSFPREDRARIMEYAIQSGNHQYFTSPVMREKLVTICKGIREAFGLTESEETFLWEQYL